MVGTSEWTDAGGTLKITKALRTAIRVAALEHVGGASPILEAGERGITDADGTDRYTVNALDWPEESDLWETVELRALVEVPESKRNPGWYELDLYAYSGHGGERGLETNVAVLFSADGSTVEAAGHPLEIQAMHDRHGISFAWDPDSLRMTEGDFR